MDRYGQDILSSNPHEYGDFARYQHARKMSAEYGELFEEIETGWCGIVTKVEKSGGLHLVELENRHGKKRAFELGPGFLYEGEPVILTAPIPKTIKSTPPHRASLGSKITNSGSRAIPLHRAQIAKPSRIWVEGKHDAELVEHVWGDDLRAEGIVVCLLDGADNLLKILQEFSPTPQARAGILLDHLIDGTKESKIATEVNSHFPPNSVFITGHPFIDVWHAIKPARLGLKSWPAIPRTQDFKSGTLKALNWPHQDYSDIAQGWQRMLRRVRDYRDLEAAFLGRVEELIDFVTIPA
ncbi:DUF3097 domain-containing protein [Actinomycetaceae bacterium TAE3-ERU4]|nr:DUF3097 domain-containing protein [Actinomycetaceae bacterium TAE3-ERU4]